MERGLRGLAPAGLVLFRDGERDKTRATLGRLHDAFLEKGLARDGVVLAVGGGVVGDLAGFAAATYMRGVAWVGVPTTLLSMVDSCIGGKVGVNHPKAKNLLGAFHQPRAVVVDPDVPGDPARARGAERRLRDPEVRRPGRPGALPLAHGRAPPTCGPGTRQALENAIATSCRIKAEVVEKDERERGLRKTLNLGHTLGHALETVTGYRRFTHGEAVGWGLVGAAFLARGEGPADGRRRRAPSRARWTISDRAPGSRTSRPTGSWPRWPATRRPRRAGCPSSCPPPSAA